MYNCHIRGGTMNKKACVWVILTGLIAAPALGERLPQILPQDEEVRRTNRFMTQLYAMHKRIIDGREVRTTSKIGGYYRQPDFYREMKYYDAASGRLFSKIQWETEYPERIHAIEVYVYDDQNRVLRDFAGWFLPQGRNAPRDTFINLHAYNRELHAYRQFDALDNRTYEFCEGTYMGKAVRISLWENDIIDAQEAPKSVMATPQYRACFAGIPVSSAGKYLTPQ
jgi:hypothetical protein